MVQPPTDRPRSPRSLLRERGFAPFLYTRAATELAVQMQTVAVGWFVYDRTRDPLDLGLIGLSQFLPALLLILITGSAADRFRRNRIVAASLAVKAVCALTLIAVVRDPEADIRVVFAIMFVFGAARAFYQPAQQALLVNVVPLRDLAAAVAMMTATQKLASITGPVLGGVLYELSGQLTLWAAVLVLVSGALVGLGIRPRYVATISADRAPGALLSGFRYMRSNRIVLGAISLDLFAVLLGGVAALMPVFARDVLAVGPSGLGLLYASPAVGGILVAVGLSIVPIRKGAGRAMFVSVALFGLAIIVFGLSRWLPLSMLALFVMGASDMISVNIRHTLVQVWTPDAVRGRVSAINSVSIGASNEIGQFRGGLVAAAFGAVPAVVAAGVCTLAVVGLWRALFPDLYAIERLDARE